MMFPVSLPPLEVIWTVLPMMVTGLGAVWPAMGGASAAHTTETFLGIRRSPAALAQGEDHSARADQHQRAGFRRGDVIDLEITEVDLRKFSVARHAEEHVVEVGVDALAAGE